MARAETRDHPPSAGPRSRHRAALVLLLCGLVVTGSVFLAAWRQNRSLLELELRKDVEIGTRSFEFGFGDYLDLVVWAQAYAQGSAGAPRGSQLRPYLAKLIEGRKGVEAISYVPRVSRDARAAFEAAARQAGLPDYVIAEQTPDGRRQPLAPAALEPLLRDGRIKPGSARVATPPSEAA
jgi:CHASE1-domain containing sensor protein